MKIDLKIAHRKVLLWILAFLVTVAAAYFQRKTGPTYAISGRVMFEESLVKFRLERAEVVGRQAPVRIVTEDTLISATIAYKRFKTADAWQEAELIREGDHLEFGLPTQPAAGKILYKVTLRKGGETLSLNADKPVICRYRGNVPAVVLISHILIIFFAMLFSNRAGLEALDSRGNPYKLMIWTIVLFFVGGFILGPIMQKFAFGVYWAGFPLGSDLTDNKTLLALLMWVWALVKNFRNTDKRGWILFAAVFMLLIYLIPHSLFGSELDYGSMAVE